MIWNDFRRLTNLRTWRILALCSAIACVNACSFDWGNDDDDNDGDGNPSQPGAEDLPEGNDGGASIALLTSKNRIRDFEVSYDNTLNVPDNATVTMDGEASSVDELQDGMILRMKFDSDLNEPNNTDEPTVTEVSVTHMLVGPITSQNPLRIMGREVIVTEDTYLEGVFNRRDENDIRDGVAALAIDSQVRVSGYLNSNNTILATRIEPGSFDRWQMVGTVESITDTTLETGGVAVDLTNAPTPADCNNDRINTNALVVITATPSATFTEEDGLQDVDRIRCSNHLRLPELFPEDNETTQSLPAEIEGFITQSNGGNEILINQQVVQLDNVEPLGGRIEDLRVGALVEVEGNIDLFTRTLVATSVKFHQRRLFVKAPVSNSNLNTEDNTFSVLGIAFDLTGLRVPSGNTSSEDIATGNLSDGSVQADIYGFVDQENNPYLISIENRGRANFDAFALMGPIDDETSSQPEILQVRINLDNTDGNTTFLQDNLWLVTDAERDEGTSSGGEPVFTLRDNNNDITTTQIQNISTTAFFTQDSFNRQIRN